MEEIKKALDVGATPDDIIYAHPSKVISHLKYAKDHDVSLMTFDSISELYKVKMYFPQARLMVRIRVEAEKCLIQLGDKFGCEPDKAVELMKCADGLNLKIIGISFHVGTGCHEAEAYPRAIHIAAAIIQKARQNGIAIQYLDIGGGFPGDSLEMFEKIARRINDALETENILLNDITVIAEPGRFFVSKAFTLATTVTSVRECESYNIYYINNGIYGSFNSVHTEHATVDPMPLNNKSKTQKKCAIWGQTEEKYDKIINECLLPKMDVGDWIYFKNMGAYSTVLSVKFYGFAVPEIYPVIKEHEWIQLQMMISSKNKKP
nr:probable ornithine decarboxylase [Halyomorpha halys]